MNNISAIIVVKDNPHHLFETITSIQDLVNEIIIADIGIENNILEKLKKNKLVKIISIHKSVPYVEMIREELKNQASAKYVFFLDPDEIVPDSLKLILKSNFESYDYVKIPRKNIIFNKWIEHSRWWPDYQVRLFNKKAVVWPSKLHSQPILSGKGYEIDPKEELAIIHHNYESIDEYLQKAMRYAKSEANDMINNNHSFSLHEALIKGLSEFISRYFADEGYKDSIHGLILSFLQMFYYLLVYCYYWEFKRFYKEQISEKEVCHFFYNGLRETNYWMIKKKLIRGLTAKKIQLHSMMSKLLS